MPIEGLGLRCAQLLEVRQQPMARLLGDVPKAGKLSLGPGGQAVGGSVEDEPLPDVVLAIVEDHLVTALEGVLQRGERMRGRSLELCVGFAHYAKGVFVEAEPDMQTVLLDALALVGVEVAPAGALAPQAPAGLIDGDLEAIAQLGRGQLEGCGDRGRSAAEHGDLGALGPRVHYPCPLCCRPHAHCGHCNTDPLWAGAIWIRSDAPARPGARATYRSTVRCM